ncbi:fibroblast growth factor receptor substrate 3 [Belonocnema kinseyi]|uniref:fibroblast growth factor receptor substrate 3 n=1 Tax=Belonocnema kinseyi TaxID=2817044 RepID=UPI00143DD20B|nr:fibroblast growth factor receptor substrate 3 [Belonocnema kinseyi]XP_033225180.1 fibroblast growth factor receptor substrate 3 [Belonocnema kinseyi]XP_033225181.1 fibroblast growth factor receptor substrate 3 [Belonocnema kinseyi]XP_033225182.1 fibroblast growth factor receptor substrate 3 [Belonocnema kinseyi]
MRRMGCINSRADINELRPNIFQVMNVDDLGNLITPGRLEVTDLDIVLHQRGRQLVKWPLRCLRRYGYDAEIFSFESGRRCPTGPGIYAFKCHRAAQLFNLVQTNIQACNNSSDDTISREIPISSLSGPAVTRAVLSTEPNYLDPIPVRNNNHTGHRFSHGQQNGLGRLSSVGSGSGPMSPQATEETPSPPLTLPPAPPVPNLNHFSMYVNEKVLSTMSMEMEHNNNKSLKRTIKRSCTVSSATSNSGFAQFDPQPLQSNQDASIQNGPSPLPMACYMNVGINNYASPISSSYSTFNTTPTRGDCHRIEGSGHAYVNISPGQERLDHDISNVRPPPLPRLQLEREEITRHCYANLEPSELENLRKRFSGTSIVEHSPLPPLTPPSCITREVNYAVLDLDKKEASGYITEGTANAMPSPPESPKKPQKGYAVIDFNKTAALSHSVNPNLVNDSEGSRKTRHNSTINDLTATLKHSSSVSE